MQMHSPRLLGTPGGPCRHSGLCVCGAPWPAQGQGLPIQPPSLIAALHALKNDTDHTSQSWVDKHSLEPERPRLSGSGGLQEESFLSRGSLISRTRCFGFKVQKHVMFKCLQPCCLKVNSGHRAVGQREGFLLCLQPARAPCCGVKTPSRAPCCHSWKCRSRWGYCLIPGPSAAPRLEPLTPGVGASRAAALWGAGICPLGASYLVSTLPGKSRRGEETGCRGRAPELLSWVVGSALREGGVPRSSRNPESTGRAALKTRKEFSFLSSFGALSRPLSLCTRI